VSDKLTPLDATFLELEEADDSAHMHIGSLMIFEADAGRPPSIARVRRHLERRLSALPRYRCRLSAMHTGGLRWPAWVPDPDFQIAAHVRHSKLPAPGGEAELLDWVARYWSRRLDRSRALWDARLVTGLEGGRWAIATKTHHALVDGVGAVDVAALLLDTSPRPRTAGKAAAGPPPAASDGPFGLLAGAVRGGIDTALHPDRLRDGLGQAKAMVEVVFQDELVSAPRCSLNVPISPERRYRVVRAELADLKRVKATLGGTVNDVILAVVTGGLRTLLAARDDDVAAPGLRAMVPVNLRTAAQRFGLGNRVSSLFVHLPVMEPDARRRHRLVAAETRDLKRRSLAGGAAELIALGGLVPPVLHSVFARSVFATRLFNITVTNVPGPQAPLYAFGARMEEVWPLVPLAADHALGIAVVSYDGGVYFGLCADKGMAEDLDVLASGVEDALAELGGLAVT
jgi:diacylglycerol O-acyltransferase / wax synthase